MFIICTKIDFKQFSLDICIANRIYIPTQSTIYRIYAHCHYRVLYWKRKKTDIMENTTPAAFTATVDGQSTNCKNNELKSADNIEDCQQQTMQRAGGNGRWCTSSVRSRSSTSFLIHNLLISCSGDVPATASPRSIPLAGRDNDNEDDTTSSSSGESKSRSCSPHESHLSSPAMDANGVKDDDDDDDADGTYGAGRYRAKRRKCTVPFRRRTASKKDRADGVDDDACSGGDSDDGNAKKESKNP